ncbi:hypothetical protein AAG570_013774 [Ranatra chinensis]|uniref:15-hydroxyprostaglandin dehydrogenase [NAD(+)] n=1 Tax=Ranatra chinensis TaxID=642074 RepID=A0ABD0YD64_9HEMI
MNRRQLAGKVAILPGASRSLGLHVARLLLDRGARVVICDVQPELNSDAAAFLQQSDRSSPFLYIPCDLACPDQIKNSFKKAIESFGRLDIVVNSLGIAYERGRAWPRVVGINFVTTILSK